MARTHLLRVALLIALLCWMGDATQQKQKTKEKGQSSTKDKAVSASRSTETKKDDKSSMIAFFKQYLKEKGVECPECRTYEDYLMKVGSEVAMEKKAAGGDARWMQMMQAQLHEDEDFWKGEAPEVPPERLLPLEDLLELQELFKKRDEGVTYLDILREAHSKGIDVEKLLGKEIPALHCDCAAGEGAEGQQQCSAAAPPPAPPKEDDDCIAHYDDEEDYYYY